MAAVSVTTWASAKILGRSIRPEYKASVISCLMSADISATVASAVSNIADSLTVTPIYAVQDYVGHLESVKLRVLRLLGPELDQNQLSAFKLGSDLTLIRGVYHAPWEQPSEGIAFVVEGMARINQYATELGIDSSMLSTANQTALQCSIGRDLAALGPSLDDLSTRVQEFLWRLDNPRNGAPA